MQWAAWVGAPPKTELLNFWGWAPLSTQHTFTVKQLRHIIQSGFSACRYPWQPFERLAAEAALEDMGVVGGHAGADASVALEPGMSSRHRS